MKREMAAVECVTITLLFCLPLLASGGSEALMGLRGPQQMGLCTEGDKMTRAKTETVRLPQSWLLHEYANLRLPKYVLEEAEKKDDGAR